ncbi:MAG: hypothetical protein Q7T16_01415 [Candidatus Burarchaeum sp.]|nr:hypothetical protein [Candidatus Burarchaeum sp.]MDO8339295.1 hypothetical protein [Candidatus Burarchaeum sp.]
MDVQPQDGKIHETPRSGPERFVRVRFSPEAAETYRHLKETAATSKFDRAILKSVDYKCDRIAADFQYGKSVGKGKIPVSYILKYGATNLFHVELANRWRMSYSTEKGNDDGEIRANILEISSHPDYDKKFKYHRR